MGEIKWVGVAVVISVLVSLILYAASSYLILTPSGNVLIEYEAIYDPITGKLIENYHYRIKPNREYTMLYRYWEAPLSLEALKGPHIRVISVKAPPGSIRYIKDYRGRVYILGTLSDMSMGTASEIADKALDNEVGCYFPDKIPSGSYDMTITYIMVPPARHDGRYYHVNLKLADEHKPYSSVDIKVLIPREGLVKVYVHTPTYNVEVKDDYVHITGFSLENQLLEVELILKADRNYKFEVEEFEGDILEEVEKANSSYLTSYNILKGATLVLFTFALFFPILIIILYLIWGREKEYTVPEYLSFVPNTNRKPWEVNLLFKSDATTIDDDALYATLLDLKKRGVIDIEVKDDDIILRLREVKDLDRYERRVIALIKLWGRDGVLSFAELKDRIKSSKSDARALAKSLRDLVSTPIWMRRYARKYIKGGMRFKAIGLAVLFFMLTIILALTMDLHAFKPYCGLITASMAGLMGHMIACAIPPEQIFGKWKDDVYKEALEWNAFRRLLENFAKIQEYKPEDLAIWQEWLIYGTTLGVGKAVVNAMKELDVPIPPEMAMIASRPMIISSVVKSAMASTGGKGGKGGFGAGGGFGGGGGGVR
ncbi:MAG: DUF2207 domain-containing protein [Thermoprotei archaeon]|nr:DUF2207 domain-containing protein [Thermoprotei archaeon]